MPKITALKKIKLKPDEYLAFKLPSNTKRSEIMAFYRHIVEVMGSDAERVIFMSDALDMFKVVFGKDKRSNIKTKAIK